MKDLQTPGAARPLFALVLGLTIAIPAYAAAPAHLGARIACTDGAADTFECSRIDLLSHLPSDELASGGRLSDIWGWIDPQTGREYAIVAHLNGTTFVDVTDPVNPVVRGMLRAHEAQVVVACKSRGASTSGPATADDEPDHDDDDDSACHEEGSRWRDVKVYADHAFVVSESNGHGLQVFDLTRLRAASDVDTRFTENAHYDGFGSAHNIAINEATGYGYAVGTQTYFGGLHFVDLRDPRNPAAAGGFGGDGYTHDAQCVTYTGPDAGYAGRELCFASNEDSVTIVDVTTKSSPTMISRTTYSQSGYVHQGWLSRDQAYYFQNDEFDETLSVERTQTMVWDMARLDNPRLVTRYLGLASTIDHNHYSHGRYLYQSNYTSGLRVLDITVPASPVEIAYFDSFADSNAVDYDGTWSNYPYFASGTIALSDMSEGLFLLRMTVHDSNPDASDVTVAVGDAVEIANSLDDRSTIRYVATATNAGSNAVDDVIVTHVLQDHRTYLTVIDGDGDCAHDRLFVRCRIGTLQPGAVAATTLTLEVNTATFADFEAHVSSLNPDDNTANNKNSGRISLKAPPVSSPPPPPAGGGGGGATGWLMLALLAIARLRRSLRTDPIAETYR